MGKKSKLKLYFVYLRFFIQRSIKKPHLVFLTLGLLFGLLYIFAIPAFNGGDEAAHFNRIFQISNGQLLNEKIPGGNGTYISELMVNYEIASPQRVLLSELFVQDKSINVQPRIMTMHFENTELYTPVAYTPQVLSMFIARLFNFSIPLAYYLAKLFGFFAWLLVCFVGIKKMRELGWVATIILLSPLCLQTVTLISVDGFTIAIITLLIGLITETLLTKTPMTNKRLLLLFGILIILAFCKMPYMFAALLVLIIPKELYAGNKKTQLYFLLISAITIGTITLGWAILSQEGLTPYKYLIDSVYLKPSDQIDYLIWHPLTFLKQMFWSYIHIYESIGDPFLNFIQQTSLAVIVPGWASVLYVMLLTTTVIAIRCAAKVKSYLSKSQQLFCIGVGTLLFLLINVLLFISWTLVDSKVILGVQSRYFIPVLLISILAFLPFSKEKTQLSNKFCWGIIGCLFIIQLSLTMNIYFYYYH